MTNSKTTLWQWQKWRYVALLLLLVFCLPCVWADEGRLQIKPARCIALHEGQVCYQTLNINWQTAVQGDYCVYLQDSKTALMCWENSNGSQLKYDFESNSTKKFTLQNSRTGEIVAEFSLEVAWVYNAGSRRESRWRIF
ncbi:MAG TPA: DUF3019 domain-containing protein [Cellvibrio sp.]|nr:DUF3019 domain-containing protein [Cellvibrio sp.]